MRNRYWLVFAAVFTWKILLFILSAQPVPANDAFFYDGAVIHHLLQGGFYNPCIKLAFPTSGTEIFSAYPPLYQLPLLAWMSLFGVSALSAIAFHLFLFGLYLLALLGIFRRLQTPAWCVNAAGFFLLTFTFHDRPDSFAQVLGAFSVYACVRGRDDLRNDQAKGDRRWIWLTTLLIVLTFGTSLQIGGIYLLVIFIILGASRILNRAKLSLVPMSLMVVTPALLALIVKQFMPVAWEGFMENVRQTPFLTGLRNPNAGDALKIIRTVPGIFLVTFFLIIGWFSGRLKFNSPVCRPFGIILLATLLPAWGIMVGSLLIISSNTVGIANYLQPLVVGSYLALIVSLKSEIRWLRLQLFCLIPAILLGSIRAIGMSTWGLACAHDVRYSKAVNMVNEQISNHPAGYKVVVSSAFLYDAVKHKELDLIHSDWMAVAHGDSRLTDSKALLALQPQKIILTQFDYYRRYREVLSRIENNPAVKKIEVTNAARLRTPDSINAMQRILQQVSWAPVIIDISWQDGAAHKLDGKAD